MLASEYVRKLRFLIAEHGDLECVDSHNNPAAEPEVNLDDGDPVFVVADRA